MSSIILLTDAELDSVCGGILNGGDGGAGGSGGSGGTASTGNVVNGNVSGDRNRFTTHEQTATASGAAGGKGGRGGSLMILLRVAA